MILQTLQLQSSVVHVKIHEFETADSSDFDFEYVFEKMSQGKELYLKLRN